MWKTKPHHPNQRSRGRWRRMEERIGGGIFNCYVLLLMDKTMNTASQAWIRRWTRQSIKQQKRAQWAARLLVSHLKQIVFLVKPDWLLVQLLSVLKCKSFWHFTRFIEHSMNLDTVNTPRMTYISGRREYFLPNWSRTNTKSKLLQPIRIQTISSLKCTAPWISKREYIHIGCRIILMLFSTGYVTERSGLGCSSQQSLQSFLWFRVKPRTTNIHYT